MKKVAALLRGFVEFRSDFTWADPLRSDGADYTELDHIYDVGRDLAHRLTLRMFD